MDMPMLDAAMCDKLCRDLAQLRDDAKPLWGTMSAPQMRGHMWSVLEYTMGTGDEMPFRGNALSRHIFRHLILSGALKIPRGIKMPRQKSGKPVPVPECSAEQLEASVRKFVAGMENGGFEPRMHPFFGRLSSAEWQKFHVAHFKHHFSQFVIWS
jgi:hypothetical protein